MQACGCTVLRAPSAFPFPIPLMNILSSACMLFCNTLIVVVSADTIGAPSTSTYFASVHRPHPMSIMYALVRRLESLIPVFVRGLCKPPVDYKYWSPERWNVPKTVSISPLPYLQEVQGVKQFPQTSSVPRLNAQTFAFSVPNTWTSQLDECILFL